MCLTEFLHVLTVVSKNIKNVPHYPHRKVDHLKRVERELGITRNSAITDLNRMADNVDIHEADDNVFEGVSGVLDSTQFERSVKKPLQVEHGCIPSEANPQIIDEGK